MWSLVREGHKQIIYGFFKYIYYHPYEVACNMINLFKAWMKQDDIENIREYINDVQYAELVNYYDVGSRQWLSPEHHGLIWRNRISSSVES
jgi:Mn-dependent DtxR family transcriptional regulator